jgi:uncharacterized protein YbbK (DUF523 family)
MNDFHRILIARLGDRRGRRVVFLSHCLLNENCRYLGGACRTACVSELVQQCLDEELGMIQMPCPEEEAWGGVLKPLLLLAYGLREHHPWLFRLRKPLLRVGMAFTRFRYGRIARRVARQIENYVRSGYAVEAVVGVDGSPSCGVQTTLALSALMVLSALPLKTLTNASLNSVLREHARSGQGVFVAELRRELQRRHVHVRFLAHDLFSELAGQESALRLTGADYRQA